MINAKIIPLALPDETGVTLATFIGSKVKSEALNMILGEHYEHESNNGGIKFHLLSETLSCYDHWLTAHPSSNIKSQSTLLADYTISSVNDDYNQAHDIIYSKLLGMFSSIIYIFLSDFDSLRQITNFLDTWCTATHKNTAIGHHSQARIFVTYDQENCNFTPIDIQLLRDHINQTSRSQFFNINLHKFHCMTRETLLDTLSTLIAPTLLIRQDSRTLYTFSHFSVFFQQYFILTSQYPSGVFNFLQASREGCLVSNEFPEHISKFLLISKLMHSSEYIASCILLDSSPPGMHRT